MMKYAPDKYLVLVSAALFAVIYSFTGNEAFLELTKAAFYAFIGQSFVEGKKEIVMTDSKEIYQKLTGKVDF